MKSRFLFLLVVLLSASWVSAKSLHSLQQNFIDLRFGMFIHFNMPTFCNEDWPDPDASPELFNPKKLDCNQLSLIHI